ncbi:MAG: phage baseplate protein [Chthoniobacteraceae bacterium]
MRAPTAAELLTVWERGIGQPPAKRGSLLLAAVGGDGPGTVAQLSIGQRDAQLLGLRERLFGSEITGLAACPACGEKAELRFDVRDIRLPQPDVSAGRIELNLDGWETVFRLPQGLDLDRLDPRAGVEANRLRLLECCLLSARCDGRDVSAGELPERVVAAIAQRMSEADPQGDVRLDLQCPQCAHRWQAPFDIVSFLWTELHAWAMRLLREVHALASAYGWREADIFALSPWRRRAYLEMLGT